MLLNGILELESLEHYGLIRLILACYESQRLFALFVAMCLSPFFPCIVGVYYNYTYRWRFSQGWEELTSPLNLSPRRSNLRSTAYNTDALDTTSTGAGDLTMSMY